MFFFDDPARRSDAMNLYFFAFKPFRVNRARSRVGKKSLTRRKTRSRSEKWKKEVGRQTGKEGKGQNSDPARPSVLIFLCDRAIIQVLFGKHRGANSTYELNASQILRFNWQKSAQNSGGGD